MLLYLADILEENGMKFISWSALTRIPVKAEYYKHETYFREVLSVAEELFGDDTELILRSSAFLIVTPDGLLSGRLGKILEFLSQNGYLPTVIREFRFNRLLAREFWRYQLTGATLDRVAVSDLVLTAGPALMILLRSNHRDAIPASVRLTLLKGPSDPSQQAPGTLRSVLGHPNMTCSMVHCADEPADLIRELGLLADQATLDELLSGMAAERTPDSVQSAIDDLLCRYANDSIAFDSTRSLQRIIFTMQQFAAENPSRAYKAEAVAARLNETATVQSLEWRMLARELRPFEAMLDPWDVISVASAYIANDDPAATKLIDGPDAAAWSHPVQ